MSEEPENDVEMMVYTAAIACASSRYRDVKGCAQQALRDFREDHPNGLKIKTDFIREIRADAFREAADVARGCFVSGPEIRNIIAERILALLKP